MPRKPDPPAPSRHLSLPAGWARVTELQARLGPGEKLRETLCFHRRLMLSFEGFLASKLRGVNLGEGKVWWEKMLRAGAVPRARAWLSTCLAQHPSAARAPGAGRCSPWLQTAGSKPSSSLLFQIFRLKISLVIFISGF